MKPINKYLYTLFFAVLIVVSACKDELDRFPFNALAEENAFNTESDFQNAVKGMYRGLATAGSYYGGQWILLPDVLADNLILNPAGRRSAQVYYQWLYTGESTTGLYYNGYNVIRRANAIIENIEKLPAGDVKSNALGEALAIRGMVHFDLVRVYGKTYGNASDTDLGVPYVTTTDPAIKPNRETVKAVYEKVVADLTQAEGLINADNQEGRLDKAAVAGLLSRVYLYMEQWQNCVDAATRALNAEGSPATIAQFPAIWRDETNSGVLFKIRFLDTDNPRVAIGVQYSQSSASGIRSEYVVTKELYDLYKDTDVRKNAYFVTSAFGGVTYNHIKKYLGRAVGFANLVDAKVLRVAEVLLNRAEAYANLNMDVQALQDLNALRQNRYTDFDVATATETGAALKEAIALERRLELAFEGHRFFDLKRKNLPVVRSTVTGERADGTGEPAKDTYVKLEAGDYRFLLPFPQAELNVNTNLQQNQGY